MAEHPKVKPVMRVSRESLSSHDGRHVVTIMGSADSGIFRQPVLSGGGEPFHFTHAMTSLCADICRRVPEFAHIDPERILITIIRCRSDRNWGLQARLVPLRFLGGKTTEIRSGFRYRVQQVLVGPTEMKYILSFYLPRFLNQTFDEKLVTVFHELYHIGTNFDGDIRRFNHADEIHGGCQQAYDRSMAELARHYLRTKPNRALYDFLRLSFEEIHRYFGSIVGVQIPTPKLLPVGKA